MNQWAAVDIVSEMNLSETQRLVFFLSEGSKGCLMAYLSMADAIPIREWATENICPHSLVGDGLETTPHVTVIFGFLPSVDVEEVAEACRGCFQHVDFQLGRVSRFESPEHDVLKVDVEGEDLVNLNKLMRERFSEQVEVTHPDYHPHLTLAYVEKGSNPELDGNAHFEGATFRVTELVFSTPDSKEKFKINLDPGQRPVISGLIA